MSESCEKCEFWNRGVQRCQKYVPVLIFSPDGQLGNNWGNAKADDWCGEFKKRESE